MEFRIASSCRDHGEARVLVVAVIRENTRSDTGRYLHFHRALRQDGLEQLGGEKVGRGNPRDPGIGEWHIRRRRIGGEGSHGEKHRERESNTTATAKHGYLFFEGRFELRSKRVPAEHVGGIPIALMFGHMRIVQLLNKYSLHLRISLALLLKTSPYIDRVVRPAC
jgi:hypothetical protein